MKTLRYNNIALNQGRPRLQRSPFLISGTEDDGSMKMNSVLLVDDDKYILPLVKNLLGQEGMSVQCAENGVAALAVLKQNTFDLMITDFDMPEMDGLSLTRQANVMAPDMPVILMTGNISPGMPKLAAEAGIATVLAKPFSCEVLLETVKRVVTKQKC